jgi:hypothetical protein
MTATKTTLGALAYWTGGFAEIILAGLLVPLGILLFSLPVVILVRALLELATRL